MTADSRYNFEQFYLDSGLMSFTIQAQYRTINRLSQFNKDSTYRVSALHFDARKEILKREMEDYKNKARQKKFKPTQKHKDFYLEHEIRESVQHPSPDKYQTATMEGFFGDASSQEAKTRRTKSASALKKIDPKTVRGTYIDDIEREQKKHKAPPVGKYDISKQLHKFKHVSIKPKQPPTKRNNLDDVIFRASSVPGIGHYNPRDLRTPLKVDKTNYKFYQKKHKQEEQKNHNKVEAKLSPFTYQPVAFDTFDSISKNKPKRASSKWSNSPVEIRKGLSSQFKSPGPAQYRLINQWTARDARQTEAEIGKVNLFSRLSKSTRAFSVYH